MLGDEPVAERAPIVDLWIKRARRNGAEIVRQSEDDQACPAAVARSGRGGELIETERAILIWSAEEGRRRRHVAALAGELGLDGEAGRGAFHLPQTANGRGVADAWAAAADAEPIEPGADRPADRLRRRGRRRPERARAGRALGAGARDLDVPLARRRLGRPRPPRHELPRARRHLRQPRGPPPAPAPRGDPTRARRAGLDREARRALRRRALAAPSRRSSPSSPSDLSTAASPIGEVGEQASFATTRRDRPACRGQGADTAGLRGQGLRHPRATARSSPAPPSSASPRWTSSGPPPRSSSRATTRAASGSPTARP